MGFPWHVPTWYAIEWLDVDPKFARTPNKNTKTLQMTLHKPFIRPMSPLAMRVRISVVSVNFCN